MWTVAVSQNRVQQAIGSVSVWMFDGEKLHGRNVRMRMVESRDVTEWPVGNYLRMGVKAFNREEDDTVSAIFLAPNYSSSFAPDVRFSFHVRVAKFTPLEHASDEELHLREGERDKWNQALSDLQQHSQNSEIHASQEEKDAMRNLAANPPRDGANGKSAYQLWLDEGNQGDISAFLASLKGDPGQNGSPGKDAQLTSQQTQAIQFILDNQSALQALLDAQN